MDILDSSDEERRLIAKKKMERGVSNFIELSRDQASLIDRDWEGKFALEGGTKAEVRLNHKENICTQLDWLELAGTHLSFLCGHNSPPDFSLEKGAHLESL